MALIDDINVIGDSARIITAKGLMGITLNGTWNAATVNLQKKIDGSWYTVKSYTDDANDIIESVGSGQYRFNTSGLSAPNIIADVTFDGPGNGKIE